jgi:hypothetical protein
LIEGPLPPTRPVFCPLIFGTFDIAQAGRQVHLLLLQLLILQVFMAKGQMLGITRSC